MFDYELIFRRKQHYITIPQIPQKKLFISNRLLHKLLENQNPNWDVYITKYPKDHCLNMVILDFDDKDDPSNALHDVGKLRKFLNRKGLNTVIVRSGRKGYHAYIQIPCHNFVGGELAYADAEPNLWFKQYIKQLIGLYDGKYYPTLDEINFSAGLGGNIRVINSLHPKGTKCEVAHGEFISDVQSNEWDWDCFITAKNYAEDKVTELAEVNHINLESNDIIADNDLREIIPEVFNLSPKKYSKGYCYGKCPFHHDEHESFFFDKERFACNSCSTRGNIWTLVKWGYIDLKNDSIRVRHKK